MNDLQYNEDEEEKPQSDLNEINSMDDRSLIEQIQMEEENEGVNKWFMKILMRKNLKMND